MISSFKMGQQYLFAFKYAGYLLRANNIYPAILLRVLAILLGFAI